MCGRYYVDDETAREIEKLEKSELEDWVYDDKFLEFALHKVPVQL